MSVKGKILFVDDDASLRTVVPIALEKDGHTVETAASGDEALNFFKREEFDFVIQDVRMPGMGGLELLSRLKELSPDVPVVVMTAFSTWDIAAEAMRLGAFDYLRKPFDNDDLRSLAQRALTYRMRVRAIKPGEAEPRFIGTSDAIQEVLALVRRVAATDSTVVIQGESGTGKELIARLLHIQSHRRDGPFIAVNCGGFSETLLESELFGHVKGAFTGAVADKKGLFELADGGTFFLDEVGEMTLSTQVRLLRVLETRTFLPVGSEVSKKTDVRFVTATNRDLAAMTVAGTFRNDLYYRMNVISLRLPPLRERKDDIPLLAGHFLATYAARYQREIKGFDPGAVEYLLRNNWPGNVRELQNAIQRAVSLESGEWITADSLSSGVPEVPIMTAPDAGGVGAVSRPLAPLPVPATVPGKAILPEKGFSLEDHLAEIEADYIRQALDKTGNNLTRAAELLGLTFRSIRYKVKKLGLERNQETDRF